MSKLIAGLQTFHLSQELAPKLISHLQLVKEWNATHNLTSITVLDEMVVLHSLDCLAVNPYLDGELYLDVGSGAGFPGIVLAIVNPDKHFMLIDSNNKKVQFLKHAKFELNLDNISVLQCRLEQYSSDNSFDGLLARALCEPQWLQANSKHLHIKKHILLLGKKIDLDQDDTVTQVQIPFLHAKRHVLIRQVQNG